MAQVTATFAEMERRRIAERTREGMARIKAGTGKHMGRPVARDVRTAEGIPTATGSGAWRPGTISKILARLVAT